MKNWSKKRKILVALLLLFIVVQAIQPPKNNGSTVGPSDISQTVQVPDSVLHILKKSCYDCHSNYSTYPWYDRITPLNWWVADHITEGKRRLNFTTFGEYPPKKMDKKLKEIAETVEEDGMPLNSYLWMHGDARLNDKQKQMIVNWVASARAQMPK